MSKSSPKSSSLNVVGATLSSLLALSLSACHQQETYVKCYGVAKTGADQWIGMTQGECKKLADSHAEPLSNDEAAKITKYSADDYVRCYGVAAASMNDCGTKTSACGGTITIAHSKDAWISIPQGLCTQIKGGIVEIPKKQ